ncbi:hypothetical protein B484DRAFT_451807 [Ochromonadaceae sp. CCMP2298]|nr:hypothetical protein B484DRAFT_451807 [Ochromonadaceae sp. CCMP2298]
MLACFYVAALLQVHTHLVAAADAGAEHAAASLVLPVSGFISAVKEGNDLAMRILRKVNAPASCRTVQFKGIPATGLAKFTGGVAFQLLEGRSYNERPAWTNGKEFISYVGTDGPFGNWLVGVVPGEDSGFMHIRTAGPSLTPLGLEGLQDGPSGGKGRLHWLALQGASWNELPDLQLHCRDAPTARGGAGASFFEVEYFDHTQALPTGVRSSFLAIDQALLPILPSEPRAALYDAATGTWQLLDSVRVIAEMGSPTLISGGRDSGTVALLVNAEHSGTQGWRCTFRHFPLSPVAWTGASDRPSEGIDTLDYQPHWTERPPEQDESEYSVLLGTGSGVLETRMDGRAVDLTPAPRQGEIASAVLASLAAVRPGDFVWLWVSPSTESVPVMSTIGAAGDITASLVSSPHTEAVEELLVRCRSRSNSTLVLDYFPSDRRDQFKQSMLDRGTKVLTIELGTSNVGAVQLAGKPVSLQSALLLGDVLEYLRRYLIRKELSGVTGLSACYLYHAAVSMPQALVYAAEIMCVLMGAKPVTMIQYSSLSDEQWKFPLVQELTAAIVGAKHMLGDALDLSVEVYRYRSEETLIISRTRRQYLAHSLLPRTQAQALHPVPYPNAAGEQQQLRLDWEAQVYNSAWNGYALGYPDFFVASYCEAFHNGLTQEQKRHQQQAAEAAFRSQVQHALPMFEHAKPRDASAASSPPLFRISLGMDAPIPAAQYEILHGIVSPRR